MHSMLWIYYACRNIVTLQMTFFSKSNDFWLEEMMKPLIIYIITNLACCRAWA